MFGSHVLETAAGLALIYLVLSILVSALNEALAALFSFRSKDLRSALKNLLAEQAVPLEAARPAVAAAAAGTTTGSVTGQSDSGMGMATAVLNHPTIANLCPPRLLGQGSTAPSYLDRKLFSAVLFDLLAP